MIKIDDILLVDNNQTANQQRIAALKAANLGTTYKIAMNGGHAQVCLEHMHMTDSISNKKVLMLLNLDTPVENGFGFLQQYFKLGQKYRQENIMIVVLTNEFTAPEKIERAQALGVKFFMEETLNTELLEEAIQSYFKAPAKRGRKPKVKAPAYVSHLRVA